VVTAVSSTVGKGDNAEVERFLLVLVVVCPDGDDEEEKTL
jgi:hypothetical protein